MLRILTDENFNGPLVSGLLARSEQVDAVRLQDVGLRQRPDDEVLAWAAGQQRYLLTHDKTTLPDLVDRLVTEGRPPRGVLIIPKSISFAVLLDDLLMIDGAASPDEYVGKVTFLPL